MYSMYPVDEIILNQPKVASWFGLLVFVSFLTYLNQIQ